MKSYDHNKIEKRWQKIWDKKKPWKANFPSKAKKFYGLIEFPYPSGDGLHVGHVRSNTAMDIIAHKRRAEGYNVLYPIGWDAFGLPAENYAIKTGVHPAITTKKNIATFRKQLKNLGMFFDWSREVDTTDPNYYKWTQWIFLQFFKKGLAYKSKASINWCPSCKIGLANEEVIDGKCERCGGVTEKKEKEQWMLAITKYAERLHKDLDLVDYLPQVKTQQRNWIGKSEGSEIDFQIVGTNLEEKVTVFTTRADTLFGATYLVLSPEHQFIKKHSNAIENKDEIIQYVEQSKKKSEIERTDDTKEKTGVQLKGIFAINPCNKEKLPVYVADYVLVNYGTGAIMAVPAHDERDFTFAKKYKLPIKEVIIPNRVDEKNPPVEGKKYVERRNVHVIVRNPKNDKYLLLKWTKHPWIAFPMGGIEDGENVIEAAKREVAEETGFTNLKYIKILGGEVRAEYFAAHKDQNRVAFTTAVIFDLVDETRIETSKEEQEAYEIIWLSKNEITYPKVVHAELKDWLSRFDKDEYIFEDDGILINSGEFTGTSSDKARKDISKSVGGKITIKFKLRDWVFSRQRYWGEPIPIINCEKCGFIPVPEKELPVLLPKTKNYKPTDNGESPLSTMEKWIKVKCPKCRSTARRETDVMPNWAGSSWYFLRYADPKNKKEFANKKNLKYFTPIDWYNGGMEHTTLHLLYSRFWHKFLYDLKLTPTSEPYKKRTSHGLILAEGGVKMSKSKGNVINPDTIVKKVGADSLRLYEMFMGPFDQAIGWSTDSLVGCRRFIERVWRLQEKINTKSKLNKDQETLMHQTIKKVSEDIEAMKFNTAVSALMQYNNELEKYSSVPKEAYLILVRLIAPFTPHVSEELWQIMKQKNSIHTAPWPKWNKQKIISSENLVKISVNGKMRATINLPVGITEAEAVKLAQKLPELQKWISNGKIERVVYIAGKIINFVII